MHTSAFSAANVPLLVAVALILGLSFALATWLRATEHGRGLLSRLSASDRGLGVAAIGLAIAYFLVYSFVCIQRYDKFLCGTWDLGIFASLFSNTLNGQFYRDFRGPFDHFQPAGIIYLGFYAVWRDARILLVLQSAAAAAAAWPLYLLVRQVSGRAAIASVVVIVYLLYPMLGGGTLHDFHILSLSPFFFFWMLLFMVRRRWGWYAAAMLLLMCVKETEALLVLCTGLYLLSRKEYAVGILTCAAALAWGFLAVYVLLPAITGEPFKHLARYQWVAANARGLTTPEGRTLALLYTLRVNAVILFFLAPMGFLALRNWRATLCLIVPMLIANFLAASLFQQVIYGHYGFTATSAGIGAAALATAGLGGTARQVQPTRWPLFLLLTAALCNLMLSYPAHVGNVFPSAFLEIDKSWNVLSVPVPIGHDRLQFYHLTTGERVLGAVGECFPKDAVIAAQNNIGYRFAAHYRVVDLSEHAPADYYLFSPMHDDHFTNQQTMKEVLAGLKKNPDMRPFLILTEPDSPLPELAFYASTARSIEFAENVRRAVTSHPDDPAYAAALIAVEQTMAMRANVRAPEAGPAEGTMR
jgi:hypothetical protein